MEVILKGWHAFYFLLLLFIFFATILYTFFGSNSVHHSFQHWVFMDQTCLILLPHLIIPQTGSKHVIFICIKWARWVAGNKDILIESFISITGSSISLFSPTVLNRQDCMHFSFFYVRRRKAFATMPSSNKMSFFWPPLTRWTLQTDSWVAASRDMAWSKKRSGSSSTPNSLSPVSSLKHWSTTNASLLQVKGYRTGYDRWPDFFERSGRKKRAF